MCHLVSWKMVPKSQAGIATTNAEIFVDSDEKTGQAFAEEYAEKLVRDGATDVCVWSLVDRASLETIVRWEKAGV